MDRPHAAPPTKVSNAQEAEFAKSRVLIPVLDMHGPEPTLMLDVANVWCPALAKSF